MTDPQPAFVLIRPQMGENIGAAARAMWNFGLDRMRLTAPRDGWPNPAANALASGAGRLLDAARLFDTTAEALKDCHYTYATTARPRELTKPVMTPEQAMQDAAARLGRGERVAVMFGPERAGLENADIAQANAIISVPVNPQFPSLNLAQCVLLTAYEWQRVRDDSLRDAFAQPDLATGQEIEALSRHYEDQLDTSGFFYPDHKAESMKLNLRNMWSRMSLTSHDVRMLHGMLRQLVRGRSE
ncbi:RNA methyltransferase [Loktanella sp. TSTF-M6]|uniref:tRNA (cytidine/uridine-2'-O-)-methyltransferase TrmJ n=1 Tax=Loktanella gaetbuli TaxID=2881335 RepID=A0ABS8BQZ7_9RHOB|nr:RNA methyltransferase [Loktanella gaetbuli]MCB5197956.1 RNA methyltransferase [Loktanella gaetbuli]